MLIVFIIFIIFMVLFYLYVLDYESSITNPSTDTVSPPTTPDIPEDTECLVLGNSYRVGPGKPCPKNVNKEDVEHCRNLIPRECETTGRCRLINMTSKFQPDGLCIPSNKNEKRFCHDFSSEECPTKHEHCILKNKECIAPNEKVCEELNTIECMDSNMKNDRCTLFGHFCIQKIPK